MILPHQCGDRSGIWPGGDRSCYKLLDLSQGVGQNYVADRISSLIELSVGGAVMRSELNRTGKVEVGEPKVVNPDDTRK